MGHATYAHLRLVTWNCNGALRKKWRTLEPLDADVLIVQECEDPERSKDAAYLEWSGNYLWVGSTKNKGIGVFVRDGLTIDACHLEFEPLKQFLPCIIDGIPLLAVWTQFADSPTFSYIGQLWKFLQSHKMFLDHEQAIVIGDMNSNVRWDKWDRWWNHSDVVRELSELGLRSAYHEFLNAKQGLEPDPTFYLHRNLAKAYHIDYAFLGNRWLIEDVIVGPHEIWLRESDHMPLSILARA